MDETDGAANKTSGGGGGNETMPAKPPVAGVDTVDAAVADTTAEAAPTAPGHGTAAIAGASLACCALTAKRCASKPPNAPACGTDSCPWQRTNGAPSARRAFCST